MFTGNGQNILTPFKKCGYLTPTTNLTTYINKWDLLWNGFHNSFIESTNVVRTLSMETQGPVRNCHHLKKLNVNRNDHRASVLNKALLLTLHRYSLGYRSMYSLYSCLILWGTLIKAFLALLEMTIIFFLFLILNGKNIVLEF